MRKGSMGKNLALEEDIIVKRQPKSSGDQEWM